MSGTGEGERGVEPLIALAKQYAEACDTIGGYAALWTAAILYPRSARAWSEYARFLCDRNAIPAAKTALQRALALSPWNDATREALAYVLMRLIEAGSISASEHIPAIHELCAASPLVLPAVVRLLRHFGNVPEAVARARSDLTGGHAGAAGHLAACLALVAAGELREAINQLKAAIESDVVWTVHEAVRSCSGPVQYLLLESRQSDEVAEQLTALHSRHPEMNLVPPWPAPEQLEVIRRLRGEALDRGLPSVFLFALPKSGSVAVGQIFGSGFRLPNVLYSMLRARVIAPWADDFMHGGGFSLTHLEPTETNVRLLGESGARNVFVHVRDLRGQIVSYIHHLTTYAHDNGQAFNERWSQWSFEQRFDHVLNEHFKFQIDWITGWLAASRSLPIVFTDYSQFANDRAAFIDRVLSAYGGSDRYFDRTAATARYEGIDYHFRRGTADAWREELTAQQVSRVNAAIPEHFWEAFGWEP